MASAISSGVGSRRSVCPRQRGEDRLPDPPDGVGDELHALIGVELARRREQPDVALADQVREREAAVLVLLGHGDDEAQVALDELLHRFLVAGADLAGERDLLLLREERRLRHLVEVLIEDVAFVLVVGEPGEQTPAPPALARGLGHRRGDGGRGGGMTRRRPRLRPGGGGGLLPSNVLGHGYVSDRPFIPATGRKVQVRAQFRLTLTQRPDKMPCSRRDAFAGAQYKGGVAQLGERVNGIHEVRGSIPLASTG